MTTTAAMPHIAAADMGHGRCRVPPHVLVLGEHAAVEHVERRERMIGRDVADRDECKTSLNSVIGLTRLHWLTLYALLRKRAGVRRAFPRTDAGVVRTCD